MNDKIKNLIVKQTYTERMEMAEWIFNCFAEYLEPDTSIDAASVAGFLDDYSRENRKHA
jgi:hypothetical protein